MHTIGDRLADTADASGPAQNNNRWLLAMLREQGQLALDHNDRARGRCHVVAHAQYGCGPRARPESAAKAKSARGGDQACASPGQDDDASRGVADPAVEAAVSFQAALTLIAMAFLFPPLTKGGLRGNTV